MLWRIPFTNLPEWAGGWSPALSQVEAVS